MMKKSPSVIERLVLTALAPIFLATLGGCALTAEKRTAVTAFGTASAALGTLVSKEVVAMRDDILKMNTELVLFSGQKENQYGIDLLDKNFEPESVDPVIKGAQALAAYGAALSALVNDTESAGLVKATTDLTASFGEIPAYVASFSAEQQGAIGSVIQSLGGFWLESKRKHAVEVIVRDSQGSVDRMCDLLIKDFSESDDGFFGKLTIPTGTLRRLASDEFKKAGSYSERLPALAAYRLAQQNDFRKKNVLKKISTSAIALKKANTELAKVIGDQTLTVSEIQSFVSAVRDLKSSIALIRTK
jgi:hypothetical protein